MKLIAVLAYAMLVNVTAKIEPDLDPVSDKKFFTKDYPDDMRPQTLKQFNHKFGHPYPTVQDSDRYDKDYVEDSNNDAGYWDAQMRYDKAKMYYIKMEKRVKAAQK